MSNSPKDSKTILELVLMPMAISIASIVASMIIANAQIQSNIDLNKQNLEAAKLRGNAERELKIIEIFLQKITDPDIKKRQSALTLLGSIDGNLAGNLAKSVASGEKLDSPAREDAKIEGAKADQRVFTSSTREETGFCDKYAKYNYTTWKDNFQKDVEVATWHVFVASLPLGSSETQANHLAVDFSKKNPKFAFRVMQTVGSADNIRYGIVVASGLDRNTARDIATYTNKCGISTGAYAYQQSF